MCAVLDTQGCFEMRTWVPHASHHDDASEMEKVYVYMRYVCVCDIYVISHLPAACTGAQPPQVLRSDTRARATCQRWQAPI